MPYVMGNHLQIFNFLRRQQEKYNFYDRVWIQQIDRINQCTVFVYQTIEVDHCLRLNPFVCEMGKIFSRIFEIIILYSLYLK